MLLGVASACGGGSGGGAKGGSGGATSTGSGGRGGTGTGGAGTGGTVGMGGAGTGGGGTGGQAGQAASSGGAIGTAGTTGGGGGAGAAGGGGGQAGAASANGGASAMGAGGGAGATGAGSGGVGGASGGASQTVGTAGGTISLNGVTLNIPAGALAGDTTITVAPTSPPMGYALDSSAFMFLPAGTVFAQPVTVTLPLTMSDSNVHLFWSNASGGFDDLGGTAIGQGVTGQITHFSTGFAASAGATSLTGVAPAGWDLSALNAYLLVQSGGSYSVLFADGTVACGSDGCPGAHRFILTWSLPSGTTAPPVADYNSVNQPTAANDNYGLNPMFQWDANCGGGEPPDVGAVFAAEVNVSAADTASLSGTLTYRWTSSTGIVSFGGTFTALLAAAAGDPPQCTTPRTVCTCSTGGGTGGAGGGGFGGGAVGSGGAGGAGTLVGTGGAGGGPTTPCPTTTYLGTCTTTSPQGTICQATAYDISSDCTGNSTWAAGSAGCPSAGASGCCWSNSGGYVSMRCYYVTGAGFGDQQTACVTAGNTWCAP